jgi:hypothetical protein
MTPDQEHAERLLRDKIEGFLSARRRSRGGWAEVTSKDVEDLGEIVYDLIALKCDSDPDGDLPIEVEIINRRTHMRSHFEPVPYEYDKPDHYFSRTELNFDIAFDAYKTARRLKEMRERDAKDKKSK